MIKRHNFSESKLSNPEFSINRINRSLSKLSFKPSINLSILINRCLTLCRSLIIKNENIDELNYGFQIYLDTSIANLSKYLEPDTVFVSTIGTKEYNLSNVNSRYPDLYFDCFMILSVSTLINACDLKEKLIVFNLSKINNNPHPFWKTAFEYLKAIIKRDSKSIYELIHTLSELTELGTGNEVTLNGFNQIYNEEVSEILKTLWLPIFNLYDCAYYKKEKEFNYEMENYLLKKKIYIEENEINDDPRYWVDFPLLGCCAYALKHGIKINVETEYAPQWVYEQFMKGDGKIS